MLILFFLVLVLSLIRFLLALLVLFKLQWSLDLFYWYYRIMDPLRHKLEKSGKKPEAFSSIYEEYAAMWRESK